MLPFTFFSYLCICKFISYQETKRFAKHYGYRFLSINLFALSITELSNEAKYICVVLSESCPIPSLMTEIGIFLLFATLAHEWRDI